MQSELKLSVVSGGSYDAGGNKATWAPRHASSNVIDLYFSEKRFEVTQEGTGPNGRPRFLINRTRQPDGKLLQGRGMPELIQKLERFWPELTELPSRLDRVEGKLDRIATAVTGQRRESDPKSRPAVGGRKRDAVGRFSNREFGALIHDFSAIDEYPLGTPSWLARRPELEWSRKAVYGQLRRWLGAKEPGCTVIKSNAAVGDQLGINRKTVATALAELEDLRLIHVEGPQKGKRRVYFHWHEWMENPEAIPTWVKLGQVSEPPLSHPARSVIPTRADSSPKFGHKETSKPNPHQTRVLAPDGEHRLLAEIQSCLGAAEMKRNGGMWRTRLRGGANEIRALRNAIEDFRNRSKDPAREKIRHPAKWFTDRYLRNLVEVIEAQQQAPS
jgi:hypothetical protein